MTGDSFSEFYRTIAELEVKDLITRDIFQFGTLNNEASFVGVNPDLTKPYRVVGFRRDDKGELVPDHHGVHTVLDFFERLNPRRPGAITKKYERFYFTEEEGILAGGYAGV